MGDWREENNSLYCVIQRKWAGCGYVFISFFGFFVMAVAGLVLMGVIIEPDGETVKLSEIGLPALFTLFGLVLFLAGFSRKRFNFYSEVRLDRDGGVLELSREKDRVEYRLSLSEIERIETFKVQKSRGGGSNSRPVTTYQIFLVKRDGAHFWLDTFYNKEKFSETVTLLATYTGFALKDQTGLVTDLDRQREYTDRFGDSTSYEPSRYVKIGADGSGTTISIHEHRGLFDRLVMTLVFTLFLAVPFYIISTFFEGAGGDDPGSILFAVFVVPFFLIFFTVLALVFIMTSKSYMIRYGGWELKVELKFRLGFLTRLLGRTLTIPRDAIRAVRVNRLDEGHFWLSLLTDGSVGTGGGAGGMLFALGAFRKPGETGLPWGDSKIVSLWEMPGWTKQGPGITDLLHVESMIQKDLGVEEN